MQSKQPNKSAEEILREQKKLKDLYRQVFASPEGWKVFWDLRTRFSGELATQLEHTTFINVGSHRVIQYIEDMMEGPHERTESD